MVRRRGPDAPRPVIAFLGLFGIGNIGNEASLRAVLEAVVRNVPNAEIHCICRAPGRVEAEHGIRSHELASTGPLSHLRSKSTVFRALMKPAVEVVRWLDAYRLLRQTDIVIVPGTGILDDFGEPPLHLPLDVYRWSVTARITGTRLIFLGVGAGPIDHRMSRWLMKRGVASADDVSFRDDDSKRFMSSIGRDTSGDRIVPDIVFSLRVGDLAPQKQTDRTVVGLGVMAYYGWSNDPSEGSGIYATYLAKLVELTIGLLRRGHAIRVLVGESGDQRMVDDLLEQVARQAGADLEGDRLVASSIGNYGELLHEIGMTDLVVATRYHNVVASLMMHRPVISLGYADKNLELVKLAGLERYAQHVETFSVSTVLEHMDELLDHRTEVRTNLEILDTSLREDLEVEFRRVLALGEPPFEIDRADDLGSIVRNSS